MERFDFWFVEARTGCTCCHYSDFYEGPYQSEADAKESAYWHEQNKTLASQFAPRGIYKVLKFRGERLPDGRIIIGDRVFRDDLESIPFTSSGLYSSPE